SIGSTSTGSSSMPSRNSLASTTAFLGGAAFLGDECFAWPSVRTLDGASIAAAETLNFVLHAGHWAAVIDSSTRSFREQLGQWMWIMRRSYKTRAANDLLLPSTGLRKRIVSSHTGKG